VLAVYELLRGNVVHKIYEPVEVPADIQKPAGVCVQVKLVLCEDFKKLFHGAQTARHGDKTV